jgi:DNA-binding NarL/FixJ family response regulator
VAERILQQFHELARETAGLSSPLTPRETEILDYMAKGYLNKQIAEALTVSEQTIKNHITSILRKLNVNARTQAVVVAIKKGLITINRE